MGVAAYNRGSVAISREIDADKRPIEFEIIERLNALPKYADAGKPFGVSGRGMLQLPIWARNHMRYEAISLCKLNSGKENTVAPRLNEP